MAADSKGRRGVGEISERDLEIYRLAWSGTWTQRELAAEFQLSGSRIHAILARVRRLLTQPHPEPEPASRTQRLEVVRQQHEERLEQLYVDSLRAWEHSQEPQVTIQVQSVNGKVTSTTRTVTKQRGDLRWLREARKIACQLADFRSQGATNRQQPELDSQAGHSPRRRSQVVDSYVVLDRRANIEQILPDSSQIVAE